MPYQSAHDLPKFVEMSKQLQSLKLLGGLLPKSERPKIKDLETQLKHIGDTVDRFYAVLGPRNWIYHESLPLDQVAGWLDSAATPDHVEQALIAYYQNRETLKQIVRLMSGQPAMRRRLHLIEFALDDHFSGRYYATVHVLMSVMDGFVNEFETVRRGLHARGIEELDASNTVVSHHLGLANAHATFRKGKSKTNEDPVYELFRNGIVHGSILNFNNEVVACKAWNRLFAVADWAKARENEKKPPEPEPTWAGLFAKLSENEKHKRAIEDWSPTQLRRGDAEFENHPAFSACAEFMSYWQGKNYKGMSELVGTHAHKMYPNAMIHEIRKEHTSFALSNFQIIELNNSAPAVCEISVELEVSGSAKLAVMRWIHEDEDGVSVAGSIPGRWRLYIWTPYAYLQDR